MRVVRIWVSCDEAWGSYLDFERIGFFFDGIVGEFGLSASMSCILKCTEHGLNRNNHSLIPPALIASPVFKSPQQKPHIHHRERKKERKRQKELTHLDQGGSTKNRKIMFRKSPLKHYSGCDPRTLFQKITPGSVFESVFCLRNPHLGLFPPPPNYLMGIW